mgnify:CR=1 FL=1
MSLDIFSAFRKSKKVIQSSLNQAHIEASRNYINNFFTTFSSPLPSSSHFKLYEAGDLVGKMYESLYSMLEKKEKSLKKVKK